MQFFSDNIVFITRNNKVKVFWTTYNIRGHWRSTKVNNWAELVKIFVLIMNNWAPYDMLLWPLVG